MELWMELLIYSIFVCQFILVIIRIKHDDLSWGIVFIPLEIFTFVISVYKLYKYNKKDNQNSSKHKPLISIEV